MVLLENIFGKAVQLIQRQRLDQIMEKNFKATKKFIANTGYVTEDHNEVIKQLMVTEYCWIHKGIDGEQTVVPVMPTSTSFVEKKEVTDKLLNFTVEFEYANNFIQNIR